eukprot:m.660472 g.660472  ORF g.660472 m.660472 type:complete len:293 (+) comp22729_c0_seq10:185-1063(+)
MVNGSIPFLGTVLSLRDYKSRRSAAKNGEEDVYFCRRLYEPITGTFSPVSEKKLLSKGDYTTGSPSDEDSAGENTDAAVSDADSEYDDELEKRKPPAAKKAAAKRKARAQQDVEDDSEDDTGTKGAGAHRAKRRRAAARGKGKMFSARFKLPTLRTKPAGTSSRTEGDGSVLDDVRQKLHVSAVPDGLPCREVEFYTICEFVRDQISSGLGGCMFVSGVPGTGKTATIRHVATALQEERDEGNLVPFDFVEINVRRAKLLNSIVVQVLFEVYYLEGCPTACVAIAVYFHCIF